MRPFYFIIPCNKWQLASISALPEYHNRFTYDANGNILTQVRRGPAAGLALDSLTYHYASNKNQLTYVDDAISGSAYSDDIDDQSSGNYEYDEIGNLIGDAQEQIDSIEWTVYGKIKRITRTSGSLKPNLEFEYSPDGHRVCKIVKPKVGTHIWTYTYYVRDAQGNIMATYDRTLEAVFDPEQTEYENVNNELVSLNGAGLFQAFIANLHPQVTSTNFIDSLKQGLLAADLSNQLQFINAMAAYKSAAATDLLTTNSTAYNYVLSQLGDQEFTEAMLAEYGRTDLLSKICTYDLNFINASVGYDFNTYLTNFATYLWSDFDQMHYDIIGFHEYGLVNAVNNLSTHQSDVITWIYSNGSCTRNTIVCSYYSTGDINALLSSYGYGNCRTAIMNQYSTGAIIYVLINGSFSFNVWNYLTTTYTADIINYHFSYYAAQSYTALVLSNAALVAPVQDANYYYSKTDYFDEIKTIYGQYTYDVLVGKFITLSNQFNDRFVLSEWHLYGSTRLGIQKPKLVTLNGSEGTQPYGTSGGRELVHIEFNGSWSEYEVDYGDTSNTTITTYSMSYDYYSLTRGEKNYELTNHLGNVLVIISDKKLKTCEGDTVNYYMADVLQATDYSAFGVILKGREYYADTAGKYGMGFIGLEQTNEIKGAGNHYSTEFREYDPRIVTWFSVDPLASQFPSFSPYNYTEGNPILFTDKTGKGKTSTHTDEDGNVVKVINDGDKGVYKHKGSAKDVLKELSTKYSKTNTSGGGTKMGETEYWDEFIVPGTNRAEGKIHFAKNQAWEPLIKWGNDRSNKQDLMITMEESRHGNILDIKTNKDWAAEGPMTGRLLNGKYATARSAGNYLAGLNGVTGTFEGTKISGKTYMKLAGAYQVGELTKTNAMKIVMFGTSFAPPPYYGEEPYTGRRVLEGIAAGNKIK